MTHVPGLTAVTVGFLEAYLSAPAGQTIAVVGPNGAGKTTLLRALAGLPAPSTAQVKIDGTDITGRPPHRRGVGYVPQDAALFPHLSALANVAYGMRAQGWTRKRAAEEARAWLERLGIEELAARRPGQLSGGQAQRVALARALAIGPRLLLLDEPLAALDAATRAEVRHGLRTHLAGYDGVCLVVTHDPVDAVALADRMLVLNDGRVAQDDLPTHVMRSPRSVWVARMLGHNAYRGVATGAGIALDGGAQLTAADPLAAGTPALATIHPDAVALFRDAPHGSPRNSWQGVVADLAPIGSRVRVLVSGSDGPDIAAEVTPAAVAELRLTEAMPVWVAVKATEIRLSAL